MKTALVLGAGGVRGRNSDNRLIRSKLKYDPVYSLEKGIAQTYTWIESQRKVN